MSAPLVLATVLAVVIPLQLFRAYRRDEASVERWASEHGLEITTENRPLVAGYLRNARVLRTWGAVAGAILPSLVELAWSGRVQVLGFGTDGDSAPLGFGTIFVGYLVGALCAELAFARPAPGARRTASLVPRELEHYLARRVILAQRGPRCRRARRARDRRRALRRASSLPGPGQRRDHRGRRAGVRRGPRAGPALAGVPAATVHQPGGGGRRRRDPGPVDPLPGRGRPRPVAAVLLRCRTRAAGGGCAALRSAMAIPAAVCLVLSLLACATIGEGSWRVRRPARHRCGVDMMIEVDPGSAVPPYEQLRQNITALVLGGGLAAGDRLPSIRQLANDLGLAGGTVARAYRELESDGVVTTHGRHGTLIKGPPRRPAPPADLIDAARSYANRASRRARAWTTHSPRSAWRSCPSEPPDEALADVEPGTRAAAFVTGVGTAGVGVEVEILMRPLLDDLREQASCHWRSFSLFWGVATLTLRIAV